MKHDDMQFEDSDGCLICNIVDGCGCWGAIALFATVSEAESLQHWDMHKWRLRLRILFRHCFVSVGRSSSGPGSSRSILQWPIDRYSFFSAGRDFKKDGATCSRAFPHSGCIEF